jgi:hypothetical protein
VKQKKILAWNGRFFWAWLLGLFAYLLNQKAID